MQPPHAAVLRVGQKCHDHGGLLAENQQRPAGQATPHPLLVLDLYGVRILALAEYQHLACQKLDEVNWTGVHLWVMHELVLPPHTRLGDSHGRCHLSSSLWVECPCLGGVPPGQLVKPPLHPVAVEAWPRFSLNRWNLSDPSTP